MAPQAKLEDTVPTTLPDDFDEWDNGEQPPATLPDDFDEFDAVPTPPAKPAPTPVAVAAPVASRAPDLPIFRAPAPPPAHPAPVLVPPTPPVFKRTQELPVLKGSIGAPQAVVASPSASKATESHAASAKYATTEELSQLVRAYQATRDAEPENKGSKKIMLLSIGAGVLVVVILVVMYFTMFRKSPETKPVVVVPQPTVSYTPDAPPPQQQGKPTPSGPVQATTDATTPAAQAPAVQSEMMNNQLNAPSRISRDIKSPQKDTAPPPASFGTGGLEGLGGASGGAVGSVFGRAAGPKVRMETPKVVTISSGVAQGMLTLRTSPVYPPIAKTARVSGTVVLQAVISKAGRIENLRVVSGPSMLRQSAADAVRNWHYKPYMLNNEPVEVETTISVVFSLGQ